MITAPFNPMVDRSRLSPGEQRKFNRAVAEGLVRAPEERAQAVREFWSTLFARSR